MFRNFFVKFFAVFAVSMLMAVPISAAKKGAKKKKMTREPGTYATFDTSLGAIVCKLYEKQAPKTVANFTGLAEGTKEWTNPAGEKTNKKLYDGTVFHRVIPDFMIQGGDPLGNGTGGPGYRFEDEFWPGMKFDRPGLLAMANAGPNTNGSQFFITVKPTSWLEPRDGRGHTVFGEVIEGQSVVDKITLVKRDGRDRPLEPVVLKSVKIERVAEKKKNSAAKK